MEKRGLSKRSQSEVITTVLIILLVIAAVFIVYVAVRNMIKGGVDNLNTEPLAITLTTNGVSIEPGATSVDVSVSRKAGAGDISEIRILFKGANGATVCNYSSKTNVPKELETVIYSIVFADIGCSGTPVSYEVYPVITTSGGKEVIGMKAIEVNGGGGGSSPGTGGCTGCVSGWAGSSLCNLSNGNLYQEYITRTCVGTTCTGVSSSRLKEPLCTYGCNSGASVCKFAPPVVTSFSCYQESTDGATASDGSCGLNYEGDVASNVGQWSGYYAGSVLAYDGDWYTFTTSNQGGDVINFTYYKPSYTSYNTSIWRVKDYFGTYDLTLTESCFNRNPIVVSAYVTTRAGIWWRCLTGSNSFVALRQAPIVPSPSAQYVYEEAMIWNVTSP